MNSDQISIKYGVTAANATVADILFIAANEFLWDSRGCDFVHEKYSCNAVGHTIKTVYQLPYWTDIDKHPMTKRVMKGLRQMGVRTHSTSEYSKFYRQYGIAATQHARYTWLMFAYEMALEQGV